MTKNTASNSAASSATISDEDMQKGPLSEECSQETERISNSSDTSSLPDGENQDAVEGDHEMIGSRGKLEEENKPDIKLRSAVANDDESAEQLGGETTESPGRRVSFHQIEIREYPRCLGDNPSVTFGPPMSIGWKHNQSYVLDVDQYENYKDGLDEDGTHQPERRRRSSAEFQLPWNLREEILREECSQDDEYAQQADVACTAEEIQARIQEIRRAKRQRQASYAMTEFEHLEVFFESLWRKLRRLRCCNTNRISEENSLVYEYTPEQKLSPVRPSAVQERAKSRGSIVQ